MLPFSSKTEQQGRGLNGPPEDPPAEGKDILKLRHKSADESQGRLKQLLRGRCLAPAKNQRRCARARSCMLGDHAAPTSEARSKRTPRQRQKTTAQDFCVSGESGMSECQVFKKCFCLHLMSPEELPAGRKNGPRGLSGGWRKTMKVSRTVKTSRLPKPFPRHDVFSGRMRRATGAQPSSELLLGTQRSHYLNGHNKIDVNGSVALLSWQ